MTTLTATTAKEQFLGLLRKTHDLGAKYTITHNGQPFAVLLSTEEYEGLLETLELLENKNVTREVLRSIKEADEGKTVPFEKVVGRKQEK